MTQAYGPKQLFVKENTWYVLMVYVIWVMLHGMCYVVYVVWYMFLKVTSTLMGNLQQLSGVTLRAGSGRATPASLPKPPEPLQMKSAWGKKVALSLFPSAREPR